MGLNVDNSVFYNEAEFGEAAVWTPAAGGGPYAITVIFDLEYQGDLFGEIEHAAQNPVAFVRDSQIADGSGMQIGDALSVRSVAYRVGAMQPDGTGQTALVLHT